MPKLERRSIVERSRRVGVGLVRVAVREDALSYAKGSGECVCSRFHGFPTIGRDCAVRSSCVDLVSTICKRFEASSIRRHSCHLQA